MKHPILTTAAIVALSGLALAPAAAPAWWDGPGYGQNGYYGAGPFDATAGGGFSFSTSFSGRGHGNEHYGVYPVYPAFPPPPPAMAMASWILHGVNFRYDSDELTPESRQILDSVASTLRERPQQALEVGGHASAEGTGSYNQDLSTRRARAVRDYLVEQGVDPAMLSYRGYGESRPLAPNITEPGRILNRRVELSPVLRASR